jgi:acyl carrier protein
MSDHAEAIGADVITCLAALGFGEDDIARDTTFATLALDPPDLVELAEVVRSRWGVVLMLDELDEMPTVGELIDRIVLMERA